MRPVRDAFEFEHTIEAAGSHFDPAAAADARMRVVRTRSTEVRIFVVTAACVDPVRGMAWRAVQVHLKQAHCVGVVGDDGALHLAPLHAVHQVRGGRRAGFGGWCGVLLQLL
jgi:hypothetical protein